MDGLTIRRARPGDGEACARLWVEFGVALLERMPDRFRVPSEEGLAAWFEEGIASTNDDVLRALVEIDGEVVGLAHAVLRRPSAPAYPSLIADHERARVILEDIVVAAHRRSNGIGTQLIGYVESWSREHGAASITLNSDQEGPARAFYERLGFSIQAALYGKPL